MVARTNSQTKHKLMEAELQGGNVDLILHAGDLAYADGNGLRWDSYGRLMEPLATRVQGSVLVALVKLLLLRGQQQIHLRTEGVVSSAEDGASAG